MPTSDSALPARDAGVGVDGVADAPGGCRFGNESAR